MKIAVIIANGSEELEALTPVDIIKRATVDCDIISVSEKQVTLSHNVTILADSLIDEVNLMDYDGIIIPGGLKGAINISKCAKVIDAVKNFLVSNKLVASICASPALVLAQNGLIDGKKATCYPANDFIKIMERTNYIEADVVIDNNLITANGPKSAYEFSLSICKYLNVQPKF